MVTSHQNWAQLVSLAGQVGEQLQQQQQTVSTAESCTGGGIGYAITEVAGSSAWFNGGFITYTNALKHSCLGVPQLLLQTHGAVSAECVEAMARGARQQAGSDWSVAVSGVAGPSGGSAEKPVGLVWMAVANPSGCDTFAARFAGDRAEVRRQTIGMVLEDLLKKVSTSA